VHGLKKKRKEKKRKEKKRKEKKRKEKKRKEKKRKEKKRKKKKYAGSISLPASIKERPKGNSLLKSIAPCFEFAVLLCSMWIILAVSIVDNPCPYKCASQARSAARLIRPCLWCRIQGLRFMSTCPDKQGPKRV